jgi:hypothetical protein
MRAGLQKDRRFRDSARSVQRAPIHIKIEFATQYLIFADIDPAS